MFYGLGLNSFPPLRGIRFFLMSRIFLCFLPLVIQFRIHLITKERKTENWFGKSSDRNYLQVKYFAKTNYCLTFCRGGFRGEVEGVTICSFKSYWENLPPLRTPKAWGHLPSPLILSAPPLFQKNLVPPCFWPGCWWFPLILLPAVTQHNTIREINMMLITFRDWRIMQNLIQLRNCRWTCIGR